MSRKLIFLTIIFGVLIGYGTTHSHYHDKKYKDSYRHTYSHHGIVEYVSPFGSTPGFGVDPNYEGYAFDRRINIGPYGYQHRYNPSQYKYTGHGDYGRYIEPRFEDAFGDAVRSDRYSHLK